MSNGLAHRHNEPAAGIDAEGSMQTKGTGTTGPTSRRKTV
jgi:hypothetical protein